MDQLDAKGIQNGGKYGEYKDMRPGKESIKRRACHPPFF
jgi:hypothetical protein